MSKVIVARYSRTHPRRRCKPEWIASSSAFPPRSCWSRSESRWTTESSHSARSPWSKAPGRPRDPEAAWTSTSSRPPAHLNTNATLIARVTFSLSVEGEKKKKTKEENLFSSDRRGIGGRRINHCGLSLHWKHQGAIHSCDRC